MYSAIEMINNAPPQKLEKLNPYAGVAFIHRVATEVLYNSRRDEDDVEKYVNGIYDKLKPDAAQLLFGDKSQFAVRVNPSVNFVFRHQN